jgi:hypothetical protein
MGLASPSASKRFSCRGACAEMSPMGFILGSLAVMVVATDCWEAT